MGMMLGRFLRNSVIVPLEACRIDDFMPNNRECRGRDSDGITDQREKARTSYRQ